LLIINRLTGEIDSGNVVKNYILIINEAILQSSLNLFSFVLYDTNNGQFNIDSGQAFNEG